MMQTALGIPPPSKPVLPPASTAKSVRSYPVRFEGSVRLYTCNMDEGTFVDFADPNDHQVFMYCWMDRDRDASSAVNFAAPGAPGEFKLGINLRNQDPDLLKLMCCMHMLDEESNIYRTITFAASAAQLDRLMRGEEQKITMRDQMKRDNYAEVTIKAVNAVDFAQSISFTRSALWDVPVLNAEAEKVSQAINANTDNNHMKLPPGGAGFLRGLSRYPILFLGLMLGTPAYVFAPVFPAGSGAASRPAPGRRFRPSGPTTP